MAAEDDEAFRHFLGACRTGEAAWLAVLATAAATPDSRVARRAMAALTVSHPGDLDARRCVPLLLDLLGRDDAVVATLAMAKLATFVERPLPEDVRRLIAGHSLTAWSERSDTAWCDPWQHFGGDLACTAVGRREVVAGMVAVAASTGDAAVVDALLALMPKGPAPAAADWPHPRSEEAVLACLERAAARVDAATAMRLRERFVPGKDVPAPSDRWARAVGCVFGETFAIVPLDRAGDHSGLLLEDPFNSRCRASCMARGVADERVVLLQLPLAREYDRDLMLLTPGRVLAALRAGGDGRPRMIAILDGTARQHAGPLGPGSKRLVRATAAAWHAVLPAIEALPPAMRQPLLQALAEPLLELGIRFGFEAAIEPALRVPASDADSSQRGLMTQHDEQASLCFGVVSRSGPLCADAVLALASTTPSHRLARRALHGAQWRHQHRDPERRVPALLALTQHEDAVSARIATDHLWVSTQLPIPAHLEQAIVTRALGVWPADELNLYWEAGPRPCSIAPGPRSFARFTNPVAMLILIAARTGDARIVDRLVAWRGPMPKLDPAEPRTVQHHHFVRACLEAAASRVDGATARRLHAWFEHEFTHDRRDLYGKRVHSALLARLFVAVPDDLLPSYAPMLQDRAGNALIRRHLEARGEHPGERLRLLLLPLAEEREAWPLLHAPDDLLAALRGPEAVRRRVVESLRSAQARNGSPFATADQWRAVQFAIAALDREARTGILAAAAPHLRHLGIQHDVWLGVR
jgi:hypothetical protein